MSRKKKELLIIYMCFVGYTLVYSITLVAPRYRMPLEQFLIIFASLVFFQILVVLTQRKRSYETIV